MTGVLGGGHQVFKWLVITHSFFTSHTSQTTPDTPIGVCRVVSPHVNDGIRRHWAMSPSCRLVA